MNGPHLLALQIADPPERWAALGFDVAGDTLILDGVEVRLGSAGSGIVGWTLSGVEAGAIDGLPTGHEGSAPRAGSSPTPTEHSNGAIGIDHVVVLTPDFERTASALRQAGLPLRRVRDAGGFRQGFRRLGPTIMEIVEAGQAPPGPARFWGLTITVGDLDAFAARLGTLLGEVRPAVQPGRRIATLDRAAGLSSRVAFMDPE